MIYTFVLLCCLALVVYTRRSIAASERKSALNLEHAVRDATTLRVYDVKTPWRGYSGSYWTYGHGFVIDGILRYLNLEIRPRSVTFESVAEKGETTGNPTPQDGKT